MPYWQAGQGQIPWLNNARDQLFDPAKLQGEWAKGYEVSPEAKDLMERTNSAAEMKPVVWV